MKRRVLSSIALLLAVGSVSLTGADSSAQAQRRYAGATGAVTLGPNQLLRVTILPEVDDEVIVQFVRRGYAQSGCDGGLCRLARAAENAAAPVAIGPGESLSFDVYAGNFAAVEAGFASSARNLRVNIHIIDMTTGQTVSLYSTADVDTL